MRKFDTTMQIFSENKYKPTINIFTPCRCSISTRIDWVFGQHKKKKKKVVWKTMPHVWHRFSNPADLAYNSLWIVCHYESDNGMRCNPWEHAKCLGLIMPYNVRSVYWLCLLHHPSPLTKHSKINKNKNI